MQGVSVDTTVLFSLRKLVIHRLNHEWKITNILHRALWSHAVLKEEERLSVGLTVNLMRLHVGLENVDDIITDLDQALRKSIWIRRVKSAKSGG